MTNTLSLASRPIVRTRNFVRARRAVGRYLFLVPALGIILVMIGYPILFNVELSLTDTKLLTPSGMGNFVGLGNYVRILGLPEFWDSVRVTIIFTSSTVVGAFVVGFGVALVLNEIGQRRGWMLTVILIPWIVSPVIAAYVWRFLFNDEFGLVNAALLALGVVHDKIAWLARPETTVLVIVVTAVWRLVPYMVVMLVAGLQSVPKELYEAADVDGAGAWAKFMHVTVSQLRYIIAVILMFATIWTFNDFTIPYVMTVGGGSSATRTLPILAYQSAFDDLRFGRAAAMGTIILFVLVVLSIVYIRILLSNEENAGPAKGSLFGHLRSWIFRGAGA